MSDPTPRSQFLRRDFLVGAVAGAAGTAAVTLAPKLLDRQATTPWSAHEKATPCYSQNGEDLIAKSILDKLGVAKPTYLDIGAFLPVFSNNTFLFYDAGCQGVLIEPNLDLTGELRRVRPRDVVLQIGVGFGDKEEQADYYRFDSPQLNTFDKDDATKVQETGSAKLLEVVKTPMVPVNKVLADHFAGRAPDYLSIDIEGLDLMVLKAIDFEKYRPKVVCAEHGTEPAAGKPLGEAVKQEINEYMKTKGYELRGLTYPNSLFVTTR